MKPIEPQPKPATRTDYPEPADDLTAMLRQWRWMAGLSLAATALGIGMAFSHALGEAVGTLALAAGLIIRAHQLERDISREVARMEDTTHTEP